MKTANEIRKKIQEIRKKWGEGKRILSFWKTFLILLLSLAALDAIFCVLYPTVWLPIHLVFLLLLIVTLKVSSDERRKFRLKQNHYLQIVSTLEEALVLLSQQDGEETILREKDIGSASPRTEAFRWVASEEWLLENEVSKKRENRKELKLTIYPIVAAILLVILSELYPQSVFPKIVFWGMMIGFALFTLIVIPVIVFRSIKGLLKRLRSGRIQQRRY